MEQLSLTGTPAAPTTIRGNARGEILRLFAAGYGPTQIARTLNARGVPTPSGVGGWWPQTVRRHVNPGPWNAYIRDYRHRGR